MFATWKYDRDTSEVQNIRLAYDPISARSSQHQACDRCHEKKLKCSGEKDGCDRCVSSAHPCVYNRSEARCSRRSNKRASRCSTDGSSAIDETLSRPTSNSGSPSRRSTQHSHRHLQQPQQRHRIRKSSQSRRKSTCSSAAQSRSSLEPDVDLMASPAPSSVTSSPYSLAASFATISEGGAGDFAAALSVPYDSPGTVGMTAQHMPYSMPYHDCAYQPGAAWPPVSYQRGDPCTSAGLSNSFISTVSNPDAFPVLTPPDDYMQFQAFASLQTAGADIWPYHR